MNKYLLYTLIALGAIGLFLLYRWKTFGTGNPSFSYATTFGYPMYDKNKLEQAGLEQQGLSLVEKTTGKVVFNRQG